MKKKWTYILFLSCLILFQGMHLSCNPDRSQEGRVERTKVVLRAVGDELLHANNDALSRVLPVVFKSPDTFELSFEKPLAFDPSVLSTAMAAQLDRSGLAKQYLVEVRQCSDGEVVYSYEIRKSSERTIVPCGGRLLPENCYIISVYFARSISTSTSSVWFYILVALVVLFLVFVFYSRYIAWVQDSREQNATVLGRFRFYPEQNVLVKEAEEITLSKKECELLTIFVAHPNKVIKREELTKKVWEDHGVIVGRSLDTYISKLRKKLQDDDTIKITNVHGVGYKLEIDDSV